jgi:hypothetical protein
MVPSYLFKRSGGRYTRLLCQHVSRPSLANVLAKQTSISSSGALEEVGWYHGKGLSGRSFSGVGDLFSAMVLAHFPGTGERPLHNAVSRALMIVQQVLERQRCEVAALPYQGSEPRPWLRTNRRRPKSILVLSVERRHTSPGPHWQTCWQSRRVYRPPERLKR